MQHGLLYLLLLLFTIPMKSKVYVKIGRKSRFKYNVGGVGGRRVVDGERAKLGEVPYQVAFKEGSITRDKFSGKTFCGGTLIGPTKILTASHCFANRKAGLCSSYNEIKSTLHMFAVMGDLLNAAIHIIDSPDDASQWRRVNHVAVHRHFNFPNNDIAIVFTSSQFNFNSYVQSIPYAQTFKDYFGTCQISGFGRTNNNQQSDVLKRGSVQLIKVEECNYHFKKNSRNLICSTKSISTGGKGDSGGPLVCAKTGDPRESNYGILVGVVSGTQDYSGGVSFYTRTSSYVEFIESNRATRSIINNNIVPFHFIFIVNSVIVYFL